MNIHQDTFGIIFSFLKPTEICRVRRLNSMYKQWVDNFLIMKYSAINIEEFVCPKCGSWIDDSDISEYTGFYNIYNNDCVEEMNRIEYVNDFSNGKTIVRKNLLCEDCECYEEEKDNINFRYCGSRKYNIQIIKDYVYPWSFLVLQTNNYYFWNEYKMFIDYEEEYGYDADFYDYEYRSRMLGEWRIERQYYYGEEEEED